MPAARDVALQPPFQGVLAEHLHDAPVGGQVAAVGVLREVLAERRLFGDLVHSVEPVRLRLVRPEEPEVVLVQPHDFPRQGAKEAGVTDLGCSWLLDLDAEGAEVRHVQGLAEQPTVGDGVGAHPSIPLRRERPQFRDELASLIEVLLRLVAVQPFFQQLQLSRVGVDVR